MKNRTEHWRRIIEDTDWENELLRQEGKLNAACWLLIVIAVLFFGLVLAGIILR